MESGNDYLLQVKRNQPKLLKLIKQTIYQTDPIDIDYTLEKNRSRIEARQAYVYNITENEIFENWPGLSKIIHIKTSGKRKDLGYSENRYYITSRSEKFASFYNIKIRDHWKIENCLHWVKDKILNEDKGMIKGMKLSENISVFRNVVINVFRLNDYKSIKYAINKFTNRLDKCYDLIELNHICIN